MCAYSVFNTFPVYPLSAKPLILLAFCRYRYHTSLFIENGSPYTGTVNTSLTGGTFSTKEELIPSSGYTAYLENGVYKVALKTTGITLNKTETLLETGKKETLHATIAPQGTPGGVIWTSDNPKVAVVDENGVVTAVAKGTANITVSSDEKSASCKVTVFTVTKPEVPGVNTEKPVDEVTLGLNDAASGQVLTTTADSILADLLNNKEVTNIDKATADHVKEAIKAGKTISTKLLAETVDEADVAEEIVKSINKQLAEEEKKNGTVIQIAQYLDLNVVLTADGKALGNINTLTNDVTFTIALPDNLKADGRVYYIVRTHNGVSELLDVVMNADGTLSFKTDRFSTYALAYADKKISPVEDEKKPNISKDPIHNEKAPETGDKNNVMLYAAFALTGLVTMGIVIVLRKKAQLHR